MKQVKFVRITSELSGFGPFKGTKYCFDGAEETVREWIEAGWDYCGFVPLETRGQGDMETVSLVFQRETTD